MLKTLASKLTLLVILIAAVSVLIYLKVYKPNTSLEGETGWSTYKNEELGFTFKYPSSYELEVEGALSADGVISKSPNTVTVISNTDPNFAVSIEYKNAGGMSLINDAAKSYDSCSLDGLQSDSYYLDGRYGLIYVNTSCGVNGSTIIFVLDRDTLYTINIASHASYSEIQDEVDKILSTFKFAETEINTRNWKTYQNSEYGFEFKYPETWIIDSPAYGGKYIGGTEKEGPVHFVAGLAAGEPQGDWTIVVSAISMNLDKYLDVPYCGSSYNNKRLGTCDAEILSREPIIINGIDAVKVIHENGSTSIFFAKSNEDLVVEIPIPSVPPRAGEDQISWRSIGEEIASSFKFN